jgi:hypothetical protein
MGGKHHPKKLSQEFLLGLQAPLYLFRDGFRQPEFLHGLFQGLQGALGAGLFALEPLPLLLEPPLLGLLRSLLPGMLKTLVVCSGLGHGNFLPLVVSLRVCHGGDHDPFFIRIQTFS